MPDGERGQAHRLVAVMADEPNQFQKPGFRLLESFLQLQEGLLFGAAFFIFVFISVILVVKLCAQRFNVGLQRGPRLPPFFDEKADLLGFLREPYLSDFSSVSRSWAATRSASALAQSLSYWAIWRWSSITSFSETSPRSAIRKAISPGRDVFAQFR